MAMTTRYVTADAPTYEVITLDVSPTTDWAADDVVTGQTSAKTCTVVAKLSATTYIVKSRNGAYTLGEVVGVTGNSDKLADQGAANPTFANVDGSSSTYPWTLTQAAASATAGDLVKVASGTYTFTSTTSLALTNQGTITSPLVFVGCDTSWNILAPTRTNGHGALSTTGMPVITFGTGVFTIYPRTFVVCRNLNITSAATSRTFYGNSDTALIDSVIDNTGVNGSTVFCYRPSNAEVLNCDILKTAASGTGYCVGGDGGYQFRLVAGSRLIATGNSAGGISTTGGTFVDNIISVPGKGYLGIAAGSAPTMIGNTFVGCGGNAIEHPDGTTSLGFYIGNQITDNTGNGIDLYDTDEGAIYYRNRVTRNGGWIDNGGNWAEACEIGTITTAQTGANAGAQADAEYISDATLDYRLRPASYGKEAGIFASDCGALQRVSPTLPAVADVKDAVAYGDPSPDNLEGEYPTAAQIAAAMWDDTTSPDRTVTA